jgi:hypothetical protein
MIFMGDWSPQKGMKLKEPVKGKGMRRLFKRNGIDVFLIDEYNTSQKMYETGDQMEKFKYIPNKEYKYGMRIKGKSDKRKSILVHGLIRNKLAKDISCIKMTIMNRDLNGSLNILDRGTCEFHNAKIPEYLMRKKRDFNEKSNKMINKELEEVEILLKKEIRIKKNNKTIGL